MSIVLQNTVAGEQCFQKVDRAHGVQEESLPIALSVVNAQMAPASSAKTLFTVPSGRRPIGQVCSLCMTYSYLSVP